MLKLHEKSGDDTVALMANIGRRARAAARPLAIATTAAKNAALVAMAEAILARERDILDANAVDVSNGEESGLSASFMDRLKLNPARIRAMADGIREIAELKDPVGDVIAAWDRPNGLHIERVRTPLGVVGVIYESRPNVTADAGALCLKAGNPVILRGGSDSLNSSSAIHACLVEGLKAAGLPEDAIQLVPTTDRAAVGEMLKGLGGNLDVIIPRGGKSLVGRVQSEARVPVFAHLEGICHLYIDRSAELDMAVRIAVNAKMRRTGVCGAAETLLVDRAVATTHLVPILDALRAAGCEIHADAEVVKLFFDAKPATDADWVTEYLDAIIAVKLVDGISGAIDHIETFSSHHTEAIVAEDGQAVERFFNEIDSAILLHNASTQFADGGEFGMGAEIGIATGKMHARGPVGVEQLTSFKYRVRGSGQVRP
ncbi:MULTISPECIES: glutamate-5-semialdehyde dehydrogenase [unclassified Mesorhizobium]|uniref:glutamate-5-semialdehyde dehydrogenase n=1 Tax=unclassified Mesorhizobium TaxID=325217 RepID=UPI000FCB0D7C|nr:MULTISPECIES: glutamate-5-semialdehyde dehydrogenase [unclassified Mesorhizobium]TGR40411.1 glutamate-5-semialdehyde dehydrogenase [bacterium M00.F.Ca.ET.199.01.1.1]TGU29615.1 glutamate-5-semialdehyde dehydrogenase [bacterium M00.F.Ca.ET.156.01.1.1]TGU90547.1 glutamate-5-semialdehyde dehydrogenase [Mesorhizobium sp. M00.F.Ca.ET.151.01.1.1]TGV12922.1 glutamate-5-semialdehyde dehydrogenase [Mesorhizobium sp. M8A.F.Ca.ET.173.01.1.1]TGV85536.1 glutamate-5-semialdehyde dehydrogenase [Mesorhizobi